ncbi:hypothetical protein BP6252_01818 [Coleophoma cylindrospora]|uniref:Mitochondrial division protein 1 n=1 Tax=Coleophoma cylindrospora TaxID=1849047 RepID=A0A3D8SEP0_9HELO|nr:hypothetical protein BP6252_01818 [Coleophoma cylindrospora]
MPPLPTLSKSLCYCEYSKLPYPNSLPMETRIEDSSLSKTKEPGPIFLLSRDCDKFLKECVVDSSTPYGAAVSSQVEEFYHCFESWTAFLCVFETKTPCLDDRLEGVSAVQDMVIRLLEILRGNAFLLSLTLQKEMAEPNYDSQGTKVANKLTPMFSGIEEAISRLNKLAIAIRQSSRSTATRRARNYAAENKDLSGFEQIARAALESLYPNASESLRIHLCNIMTDRYAKLEFLKHKHGQREILPKPTIKPSVIEAQSTEEVAATPSKTLESYVVPRILDLEGAIPSRQRTMHPPFSSSLDRSLLHENLGLRRPITQQPESRVVSVYNDDEILHEPRTPDFEVGKMKKICEWCYKYISKSVLDKDGRWSASGKQHYRKDLKPFSCLSEFCENSRPNFASREEWQKHMDSVHSPTWPEEVHKQMMLVCEHPHHKEESNGHRNHAIYQFSRPLDLENHERLHHRRDSKLPVPSKGDRREDVCPLCLSIIEESKDCPATALNKRDGPRSKVEAAKLSILCKKHIAAHLQYLMVVSLRLHAVLGVHQEGDGELKEGGPVSEAADRSSSPLGEALAGRNLNDDLPPIVHGSQNGDLDPNAPALDINIKDFVQQDPGAFTLDDSAAHQLDAHWDEIRDARNLPKPDTDPLLKNMRSHAQDDNTVKLWDSRSGALLQTLKGHSGPVRAVVFSPDGKTLASSSDDRTVKLWEAGSGALLKTLKGHSGPVRAVVFSPDGKTLASSSDDKTVKLWEAGSGALLQTLNCGYVICSFSFSADGTQLQTDGGSLPILSRSSTGLAVPDLQSSPAIFVKNQWVYRRNEPILWLPPDHRTYYIAVHEGSISLGCASGRVTIIKVL